MPPVAISRRACLLLAPLLLALSLPAPVAASDALPLMPEASTRSGLKIPSPSALTGGRFKFEGEPEGTDGEAPNQAAEVAPRPVHNVDKSEYALPTALSGSASQFREKGVASWYGKMFHGRKTSSGDTYDMYAMTAAHPSLPIPSYVRVTNLANGRSAVVRINDRGPFTGNRVIDLSQAAAQELGMQGLGIKPVEIWRLGKNEEACPEVMLNAGHKGKSQTVQAKVEKRKVSTRQHSRRR